jgi:hypothetical protein
MSSFLARTFENKQVGYVPHTSTSGETWAKTTEGTTTGAGNAGGTTLVNTSGDSGAADTYNGQYWIEILSGTCKGEERRIVDDDGAGTLTVETAFSAQIAGSVDYVIRKSPEPVVVATTGGTLSTTQINMDARNEDDDFWKGYYLVPLYGACAGEAPKLISAFDQTGGASEGLFTFAAFVGTPVGGDVFLLRKFIDVDLDPGAFTRAYHARPGVRLGHTQGDGVVGAKDAPVSFNLPIRPSGTLAAADANANAAEASGLMQAIGLEEVVQKSVTVGAGNASASAVSIATGDRENLAIGGLVCWNNNWRRITSLADGGAGVDTMNVSPAFPLVPPAADVIYAARMYKKSTTPGNLLGACIEVEVDGVRHTLTGCKGNASLANAGHADLAFSLQADHWIKDPSTAAYNAGAAYSTIPPVLAHDCEFYLDTTATGMAGFTATPGTKVAAKKIPGSVGINGRAGFEVTGYAASATFDELLNAAVDTLPQELKFTARTAKALLAVFGSAGDIFAVTIPVARMVAQPATKNADGMIAAPNVLAAHDAGTALNNTTYERVPDFAFHIS